MLNETILPSETFEELVTKSTKYDEFVDLGYENASEVDEEIELLEDSVSDLATQIAEHECPIIDNSGDVEEFKQVGDTKLKINGMTGNTPNYAVYEEN